MLLTCSMEALDRSPNRAGGVAGNGGGFGVDRLSSGHHLTGAARLQVTPPDTAGGGECGLPGAQPPNTVLMSSGS